MTAFLIKSTVTLAVLLAVYLLFLEREKMHRFNRFYLLGALVFSLVVPFISIPVYVEVTAPVIAKAAMPLTVPAPAEMHNAAEFQNKSATAGVAVTPEPDIDYFLFSITGAYILVMLLLLIRFIRNISRFYSLARSNDTVTINGARVVLLHNCPLPYTFMGYMFISKDDYKERQIEQELFTHEFTHIKQYHTLDILFAEALKTVFWFNPLLFAYKRAIQLNHEFLADEAVIYQHCNIPTYQQLLLDKALPLNSYALASSINFSITKKRFLMMTKATTKTKSLLLKLAVLPVVAVLTYTISTKTVALAKENPAATQQNAPFVTAVGSTPDAEAVNGFAVQDQTFNQQDTTVKSDDTLAGDKRRDEYFKGVQIVIDDAARGVSVNLPYENLPARYKRFYLTAVPDKKEASLMPEVDYTSFVQDTDATFFLNEKKITHAEFLKYKREDFATYGAKWSNAMGKDNKMETSKQVFLFTHPFFDKNIKHLNDHYPDKEYVVKITDKPVDTTKDDLEKWNKKDADGKSGYEREQEEKQAKLTAATYEYVAELKENTKNADARFLGKEKDFTAYINNHLTLPAAYQDKEISVFYSINTDGTVSGVSVFSSDIKIDQEVEKKIEKLFTSSPGFIPTQKNGQAVKINTMMILKEDQ